MNLRQDIHNSDIPRLCQACEARHRGLCGALEPKQLVALSKTSSRHRIQPGTELIGDSESIDSFSNILSGVLPPAI
jgi:CRP/FNR family transcriptional regulator